MTRATPRISRRRFVQLASLTTVGTLGRQNLGPFEDEIDLPRSRILRGRADEEGTLRPIKSGSDEVTVSVHTDQALTVLQRVWNIRADSTTETTTHEIPANTEEFHLPNPAASQKGSIGMVYLATDGMNDFEYELDVVGSELRSVIESDVRAITSESDDHNFTRKFTGAGIEVNWHHETGSNTELTLTIPYSLYTHSRGSSDEGFTSLPPGPGANTYSKYTHGGLERALHSFLSELPEFDDQGSPNYLTADLISTFVQHIPHATDWASKRVLNYVRTPEETLSELTADCKDAAALMYHLFDNAGYSPVFVFLLGAAKTSPLRIIRERNGDGLYPNHLSVAVPLGELEPIPTEVRQKITPIEHQGSHYAYVEATANYAPGVIPSGLDEGTTVIYNSRNDFVTSFLTGLSD